MECTDYSQYLAFKLPIIMLKLQSHMDVIKCKQAVHGLWCSASTNWEGECPRVIYSVGDFGSGGNFQENIQISCRITNLYVQQL